MTVKQLRKALKNYPPDYTVVYGYRAEDAMAHGVNTVMTEPYSDEFDSEWVLATPDRVINLNREFYGRSDFVYLG